MPNSPEQPRQGGREANFSVARTNNSQPSSKPTHSGNTSTLTPDGLGFEERLERNRKLIGLKAEEARLRLLDSVADLAEAKAEEAGHQAAAESARQKMSLWERAIKLLLIAILTLAVTGLAIAMFIVNPWLLYLGLPITAIAAWKRFGSKEKHNRKDFSEDEGDP
jgi:hypothetical protein